MPAIVHFEVVADDLERARKFYEDLFSGEIKRPPVIAGYYSVESRDLNHERRIGAVMGKSEMPGRKITTYFGVRAIEDYTGQVELFGGKVVQPKVSVPGWGYFAIFLDAEDNMFGLWQEDRNAN